MSKMGDNLKKQFRNIALENEMIVKSILEK